MNRARYNRFLNYIWFDLTHMSSEIICIYTRFIFNTIRAKLKKDSTDYSSEQLFWERVYYEFNIKKLPPYCWNDHEFRNSYTPDMLEVLEALSRDFGKDLKLIDVGSGPITSFIGKLDIYKYNITTVDPLANTYNSINKRYNPTYPLICTLGIGEQCNKLFEKNSFHLVLSHNAIDHSVSPEDFVKNLYYILKPGGFMYLSGHMNEGKATNWKGLHQHNIFLEDEDLLWTNKSGSVRDRNITGHLNMKIFHKEIAANNTGEQSYIMIYMK